MKEQYNNLFKNVANSVRGTSISAWVLILSVLLLIIGINNFAEDTYSSYVGIKMIEQEMGMNPVSWNFTYWAMSLFFQVCAVIFFFVYLSNRQDNWYFFWLTLLTQFVDFGADVWYRSDGKLFQSPVQFVVSMILTFVFFTAGSEMAITIGFGLVAELFRDGFIEFMKVVGNIISGISGGLKVLSGGKPVQHQQQQQQQQQRQHQQQQQPRKGGGGPEEAMRRYREQMEE